MSVATSEAGLAAAETFSRRLVRRQHLWWERPRRGGRTLRDAVHGVRERRTFRRRDDPDGAWRCCASWQRTLINKWNGREFAARHGCPLPELYWCGSDPSRAPLESLPDAFVIRPVFGLLRRGVAVVVDGRELIRGGSASAAELRAAFPRSRYLPRRGPVLIEEFVGHDDSLPLEYKVHVYGEQVGAVSLTRREVGVEPRHRFYARDWEPLPDPINTELPQDDVTERPRCLGRMLNLAAAMGAEIGTYMRVDFFGLGEGASDCVFNEFSSVPAKGRYYTPYADRVFGELWTERLGASV